MPTYLVQVFDEKRFKNAWKQTAADPWDACREVIGEARSLRFRYKLPLRAIVYERTPVNVFGSEWSATGIAEFDEHGHRWALGPFDEAFEPFNTHLPEVTHVQNLAVDGLSHAVPNDDYRPHPAMDTPA